MGGDRRGTEDYGEDGFGQKGTFNDDVETSEEGAVIDLEENLMAANGQTKRRQRHGSAWYWKQTDCWYYTPPGTKKREALVDDQGKRVRGPDNKQAARLALARVKLKQGLKLPSESPNPPVIAEAWSVARVCSEYLGHCERAVAAGGMHPEHRRGVVRYLNEFCRYCGALEVSELKRGYVSGWVDSHPGLALARDAP